MSYDLRFLPKAADQSWEQVIDAAEERLLTEDGEGQPVERMDPGVWPAIVAGAREILGEVSLYEHALTHRPTGIRVTLYRGEASVTAPYWYTGERAEAVARTMYRLGHVVEAATGLAGYDPQLGLPLAEAQSRVDQATVVFDQAAATLASYLAEQPEEHFHVYFAGATTYAEAARALAEVVEVVDEGERLRVQWDPEGPAMWVTYSAGPEVAADAARLAEIHRLPELAKADRRFEVGFNDLDEVLNEINTLIEVQVTLQDLTRGYIARSWNPEVSPPEG